jgi:hypothetical protein
MVLHADCGWGRVGFCVVILSIRGAMTLYPEERPTAIAAGIFHRNILCMRSGIAFQESGGLQF